MKCIALHYIHTIRTYRDSQPWKCFAIAAEIRQSTPRFVKSRDLCPISYLPYSSPPPNFEYSVGPFTTPLRLWPPVYFEPALQLQLIQPEKPDSSAPTLPVAKSTPGNQPYSFTLMNHRTPFQILTSDPRRLFDTCTFACIPLFSSDCVSK